MMEDKLKKLMQLKKGKKPMSDVEKEAKMNVAKELRDFASGEMADKLKGLKKVSVASDSPEGLKAGLEKAQAMIDSKPSHPDEDENTLSDKDYDKAMGDSDGSEMDSSEEESEESEMSEEEIDKKLQELMAKKAKLKIK